RSTPIVLNGKLYTIVRDQPATENEGEKIVCVDAATGEPVWEYRTNMYLSDVPDTRLGWSNAAGDPESGHVYFQSACGYFACLEGDTGKLVWDRSMHEEFGLLTTYGGRTNTPLVFENLVICSGVVIGWGDMRVPAHRFLAFDKATGDVVWFAGTSLNPYDTTYSTPTIKVVDGQAMMIFGSGDGDVWALQPRTGKQIWSFPFSRRGLNVSPLVVGNRVFAGHSEENVEGNRMGALVALQANASGSQAGKELWQVEELMVGKSSPVLIDDRLYAIDDRAKLFVLDAETGKQLSRTPLGTVQRSSPLYADGKIYVCTNDGRWYILEPDGDKVKKLQYMRLDRGEASDGSPIVSHGRIYIPTSSAMYCIGKDGVEPSADPIPEAEVETPVSDDDKVAQVQIVPCEVLLAPGGRQQFTAKLFNDRGQSLGEREVDFQFAVDGPGEISEDGVYVAPSVPQNAAVTVNCQVGEIAGRARVRIIPELPWSFDFESGLVPVTWVGMRNRCIVGSSEVLDSLAEKSRDARKLYLFLKASWTNAQYAGASPPALKFISGAPRDPWASMLDFMEQSAAVRDLASAKGYFEPLLEHLVAEKVVKSWTWQESPLGLTVERGERDLDGHGVMVKLEKIPVPGRITKLGTRSQGWCGPVTLSSYTAQADFRAHEDGGKLPDMGLINQRYTLTLLGASQELQLGSWVTHDKRTQATLSLPWQAGKWYTMKMTTQLSDGKAHVRGKIWLRDEAEPNDWTIEIHDASPNKQGSPGFFGNAKDTEFYIDNYSVVSN
ncbi:MAG: PQQ-binding-like beta-propeller repeat protein, partial [Planctomycetales bacterium]|nr:PQQ-binding-like beta-propeller repeat protein [Planctomycetales bacterium]